jgi:hypothetical protein
MEQNATRASCIHEIKIIENMRDMSKPTRPFSSMKLHPRLLAIPYEELDERLVVVLDPRGRLAALGFPHGDETCIFERRRNNMVNVITVPQCIVEEGIWRLLSMIRLINGEDGWNDGMSILGTLNMLHQKEREWAAQI